MEITEEQETHFIGEMRRLAREFREFTDALPHKRGSRVVQPNVVTRVEVFLSHGDALHDEMRNLGLIGHWSRLVEASGLKNQMEIATADLG